MKTCFISALKSNVGKELFNYVQQEKDQMRRLRVSLQAGAGKRLHGGRTAFRSEQHDADAEESVVADE